LIDSRAAWNGITNYRLQGFDYDQITATDLTPADRLNWLSKNVPPKNMRFDPQPYSHLARVYNRSGLRRQVGDVLAAREAGVAKAQMQDATATIDKSGNAGLRSLRGDIRYLFTLLSGLFFGYGYSAMRALGWTVSTILVGALFFWYAWEKGAIVPDSDVILTSNAWLDAYEIDSERPAHEWGKTPAGKDYETFVPLVYAFDLFIPLDALGQENAWAPSWGRGWIGKVGNFLRWGMQTFGWFVTAFLAAFVTGFVGRRAED
jgi:hypothetical protein